MKRSLAFALALSLTAALAACGSKGGDANETTTTTTTAATEVTTTSAPAETLAAETTAAADETPAQPRPFEDIAGELADYDSASLKFSTDSDISYAGMFNKAELGEEGEELYPGDEGYTGDEAVLNISVEELGGIPMLKIESLPVMKTAADGTDVEAFNTTKLRLDMNKLFEGAEDELDKIFTVKMDLIIVAEGNVVNADGEFKVPAWNGGAVGTNNNGEWNGNMMDWSVNEWTSEWAYVPILLRPGVEKETNSANAAFSKDFDENYLTFMQWIPDHKVNAYIADITFLDEEGKVIACPVG